MHWVILSVKYYIKVDMTEQARVGVICIQEVAVPIYTGYSDVVWPAFLQSFQTNSRLLPHERFFSNIMKFVIY
jgi:hypothetical protein